MVFDPGVLSPGVFEGIANWTLETGRLGIFYANSLGESINLNDQINTKMIGFIGGGGLPRYEVLRTRAPYQRGSTAVQLDVQERIIEVPLMLMSQGAIGIENIYHNMARVLNPDPLGASQITRGVLTVSLLNGTLRACNCVLMEGADWSSDGFQSPEVRRHLLRFASDDVAWYDPYETEIIFSGTGGGHTFPQVFPEVFTTSFSVGNVTTINYDGDSPGYPFIRMYGPMTNPSAENITTGKKLEFVGEIPEGGYLDIRMDTQVPFHTLIGFGTEYIQKPPLTRASRYWSLQRGANNILLKAESPATGGQAEIRFHTAYMGL